jgi:hypothetical protein
VTRRVASFAQAVARRIARQRHPYEDHCNHGNWQNPKVKKEGSDTPNSKRRDKSQEADFYHKNR